MMHLPKLFFSLVACVVAAVSLGPQSASQTKPSFGVASIKLNTVRDNPPSVGVSGCRFVARNATFGMLVQYAFRPADGQLPISQILGIPSSISSDRYNIDAKPDDDTKPIPQAEMQRMVQSLLEVRFQLRAHFESREMQTYDLVVAKSGAKIKPSADQTPTSSSATTVCNPAIAGQTQVVVAPLLPRGGVSTIGMPGPSGVLLTLTGNATPLSTFISLLQSYAGRPVVDKTDIKGLVDFKLQFGLDNPTAAAAAPPDPSGPSVFTAVQEQLGLRLEPAKGPINVFVIESAQRPSENGALDQ